MTRLTDLAAIARNFGYKIKTTGTAKDINKSINRMLADVKGKGEENLLSVLAIRSMAKAIYSTDNIGQLWSGIRLLHPLHIANPPISRHDGPPSSRQINLSGSRSVNVEKLEEQCKHSSQMEQLAANAERSSIKYKQCSTLPTVSEKSTME